MGNETDSQLLQKTLVMPKWAVVGASPKPDRYSYKIVKILKERGYTVYPIRPKQEEILGLRCYPSLSALPEKPDVVDMVVNPSVGLDYMKEMKELGLQYVWLQPGSESPEIHDYAKANGIHAMEACILAALSIRRDFRIK